MPSLISFIAALLMTTQITAIAADPVAQPAAVQDDENAMIGQIYDMRDMPLMTSSVPVLGDNPILSFTVRNSSGNGAGSETTSIVQELCDAMGMSVHYVMTGLAWVQGTKAEHDQLQQSLTRIRALYTERYEVELVAMAMDADRAPAIGAKVERARTLYSSRQVISASQPAEVHSVTTYRFVQGFEPVVGDNAIAYSTVIQEASEGLKAILAVDPARGGEGNVAIDVKGTLSSVDLTRSMPFSAGEQGMRIDLPTFMERSFESHLTLTAGQLTTLSVVDAFDHEGAIVIAAMVKKVK